MYSLQTLHEQLESCNKANAYLHIVKLNGYTFLEKHNKKQKHTKFSDIFEEALRQVNEVAKNPEKLERERDYLKHLAADEANLRIKYMSAASWTRSFLKILARCTPSFLKKYLPSCFSDRIEVAEKEAIQKLDNFCTRVKMLRESTTPNLNQNPPDHAPKFTAPETSVSQPKKPSLLEHVTKEKKIDAERNVLRKFIQSIQKNDDFPPLSLNKFKQHLYKISLQIYHLKSMGDSSLESDFEKEGLDASLFAVLTNHEFIFALRMNNDQMILDRLKPTRWHESFSKSYYRKGWIEFGIETLQDKILPTLSNEQNKRLEEQCLKDYTGEIVIKLYGEEQIKIIMSQFQEFLSAHPLLRPCKIKLKLESDGHVNVDIFKQIRALTSHDRISEIELPANVICYMSEEEEWELVQNLSKLTFPNISNIVLRNDPKTHWTSWNFSELLFACPTLEMLNTCYRLCPNHQKLLFPQELIDNVAKSESLFVFKGLSLDKINSLLSFFKPKHLDFRNCELKITDSILAEWINQSYFKSVQTLYLNSHDFLAEDHPLTTDAIESLAKLENLTQLYLPELFQGKKSLDDLPVFDKPFKVKKIDSED